MSGDTWTYTPNVNVRRLIDDFLSASLNLPPLDSTASTLGGEPLLAGVSGRLTGEDEAEDEATAELDDEEQE